MKFSIKTAFLLMTTVGLAIGLFLKHAEHRALEKEFAMLQASSDVIPIKDESRLYVRQLKVNSHSGWHYQFAVPENRDYLIRVGEGLPDPDTGRPPVILESKLLVLASELGEILQPVIAVEIVPSYDRYTTVKSENDLVGRMVKLPDPNNRKKILIFNSRFGGARECHPEMNWVASRAGQSRPARSNPQHPVRELDADSPQTLFKMSEKTRRATESKPRVFEIWIEPK